MGAEVVMRIKEIYKTISALQKVEFGVKQFTDYEDRFQFFLGGGIFLLLVEFLMSEKKVKWLAQWNPLKRQEEVSA